MMEFLNCKQRQWQKPEVESILINTVSHHCSDCQRDVAVAREFLGADLLLIV